MSFCCQKTTSGAKSVVVGAVLLDPPEWLCALLEHPLLERVAPSTVAWFEKGMRVLLTAIGSVLFLQIGIIWNFWRLVAIFHLFSNLLILSTSLSVRAFSILSPPYSLTTCVTSSAYTTFSAWGRSKVNRE